MKIRHHVIRKFHESRQAPLWKWAIIIFLVVAMPLFFSFVRVMQTEQVIEVGEGQSS